MKNKKRCGWVSENPLYIEYHDKEWGRPIHNDKKLFEFLILESFQAGLSWLTILKKRENFRKVFVSFDANKISKFNKKKIENLMKDEGIIRNRLKIIASINNAQKFLEIQKEFGSFDKYIWSFVGNKQIKNKIKSVKQIPTISKISDMMSFDMKKRGFRFVGSTICYAFMQAVGMVDDHTKDCFLYK